MFKQTKRFAVSAILAALLMITASCFLTLHATAESVAEQSAAEEYQEPEYVDPESAAEPEQALTEAEPEVIETEPEPEPEQEPQTEARQDEPETEYIAPETEQATEPLEPETHQPEQNEQQERQEQQYDEPETKSVQDEYIALIQSAEEPTNFIAPQMDKSVSQKKYSTDYTAGIISWICVGVGIIVVIAVLVSNKLSGRKAQQRFI